jgi:hypothetical protein
MNEGETEPMSNDLATRNDNGRTWTLAPRTFDEAQQFAKMLAQSDLVPKDYKGKAGNVMVAIQMGAELGLSPMQAIQNIAVINGRPSLWGDAMLALVLAHPECDDVQETDDGNTATCTVLRKGRKPVVRTFSVEDAKQAGLAGKDGPWRNYPKRMRQMRARAFALRDAFADVMRGLHVAEEAQDIPMVEARATVRDPAPESTGQIGSGSGAEHVAEVMSDAPRIPYGEHKDKPIDDPSIPGGYLREFLAPALAKAVKDPKKSRFRADNQRLLEAVQVEVLKRDAVKADAEKAATSVEGGDPWGLASGEGEGEGSCGERQEFTSAAGQ